MAPALATAVRSGSDGSVARKYPAEMVVITVGGGWERSGERIVAWWWLPWLPWLRWLCERETDVTAGECTRARHNRGTAEYSSPQTQPRPQQNGMELNGGSLTKSADERIAGTRRVHGSDCSARWGVRVSECGLGMPRAMPCPSMTWPPGTWRVWRWASGNAPFVAGMWNGSPSPGFGSTYVPEGGKGGRNRGCHGLWGASKMSAGKRMREERTAHMNACLHTCMHACSLQETKPPNTLGPEGDDDAFCVVFVLQSTGSGFSVLAHTRTHTCWDKGRAWMQSVGAASTQADR